jgi:hypothetical protein
MGLAPTLHPAHVVVMDNFGAHKVAGVREATEGPSICRPIDAVL